MKILDADFVTSMPAGGRLPPDAGPVIAMVGRSNVGKSSLINALIRRGLARAGAKPGTTRLVNLYAVRVVPAAGRRTMRSTLADLPGYGFARGGPEARREFETIVRDFFEQATLPTVSPRGPTAPRLAGVILLVDGRHPGLASDAAAQAWLAEQGHRSIIVTTKNDRMSRSAQARARRGHEAALGGPVLPVSSRTGAGVSAVRTAVGQMLSAATAPVPADGLL
ncbi:MAG: 50S ribosome-binding GTPase [Acidobacteriota bacterium]|nr:50S ribosome-binding GTPase [Acidobacteriota bacterium]